MTDKNPLILPPQFLGSTAYYAMIANADSVVIDCSMNFDKRFKSIHRCTIDGANNTSVITIPIQKPLSMSKAKWKEVIISAHGAWWNELLTAMHSAYGRTPFFEFYIDDFAPHFTKNTPGISIIDLDIKLDTLMRRLLQIDTPVTYLTDAEKNLFRGSQNDFNTSIEQSVNFVDYYQIRALKHGFQPNLSAVDLLFNMGPESPLILRQMAK